MTKESQATRRDFLRSTTVAAAGTAVAANLSLLSNAHAAGNDVIKVGLIGCGSDRGGRGRGAAENCVQSAPNVKLVAMGDVFKDNLELSRNILNKLGPDKIDVPDDRCFVGLDAYEKVLASGVDMVILATPPGFRPLHIQAAIAAGKHVFAEKPVAVDGPGYRKVMAAYDEAKKKGLSVVAGTQRRHQTSYLEAMRRIHDGDMGEIVGGQCYWNQGPLWVKDREPNWSDLEYHLRNWYYMVWLCGDHICEQHVHNLDVINWAIGHPPVRAVGMGGRQVRIDPKFGYIFDHFAIDYEYPKGVHVMSMCRQIDGCESNVSEKVVGTKGDFTTNRVFRIKGEKPWRLQGPDNSPYVQEHTDLVESIRSGKPINELKNVAESSLTAIMGRMSAYTGKAVSWDQAAKSKEETMPAKLDWDMSLPVPAVAIPGRTPLV
jgi:predicted dehydrogenase